MTFPKNKAIRLKGPKLIALVNECLDRDRFMCQRCAGTAYELHHIVYKSRGGSDCQENLISLCRACHTNAHVTNNQSLFGYLKDYHLVYVNTKTRQNYIREAAI